MALAFVVRRPLPMEGTFRPFRWWATPHRRAMVSIFWEGESPIRRLKGQKCRCHRHRTGPLGVDHCRRGGRPQTTPPRGGGLHPRDRQGRQGRQGEFGGGLLGLAERTPEWQPASRNSLGQLKTLCHSNSVCDRGVNYKLHELPNQDTRPIKRTTCAARPWPLPACVCGWPTSSCRLG